MAERFLEIPSLPSGAVTLAAVSCAHPQIIRGLERLGIEVVPVSACEGLPLPVRTHADMICIHLGGSDVIVARRKKDLVEALKRNGFHIVETQRTLGGTYPQDCLLNAVLLRKHLFARMDGLDPELISACRTKGLEITDVRQGYAKCSTAVIGGNEWITADPAIARAARSAGVDVLQIRPGHIELAGYGYGFIGGCCGCISKDVVAFTGKLDSHPDGFAIRSFLERIGKRALELSNGPLIDVGGILPLKEKD